MYSSLESILLVGSGGHSVACIDVIERDSHFAIVGIVGQCHEIGMQVLQYPVIGMDENLPSLIKMAPNALVTVGQINTAELRIRLFEMLRQIGFKMPVIVSPLAYVSRHAQIGEGTIVMHGATINAGSRIGENCIINSHALIEHGAQIGNHCHISTGAILNGQVSIGEGSFIGSGSVIKEGVSLGQYCLVGMGLSVRHDQLENARIISNT